jgi:hypothetical protein
LVSKKVKNKRSKFALILLLPWLIFIGAAGWFMYSVGDNHRINSSKSIRPAQKDNVTLLPIILEDDQKIRIHNSISNN